MKKLTFGALLLGVATAAACGGGDDGNNPDVMDVEDDVVDNVPDVDAAIVVEACNVNAQTGCGAGEKCSWVRVEASAQQQLGVVACVPDGNVGADAQCTWGAAGQATGYDNCEAGLYCSGSAQVDMATGVCTDSCSLDGSGDDCAAGFACVRYADTYANDGQDPDTGLCDPTCDALTQKTAGDGADQFCGAGLDMDNNQINQCTGLTSGDTSPTAFSCGSVLEPTFVHGTNLTDLAVDPIYLNNCAPRNMLGFFYQGADDAPVMCLSLCEPGDVYLGSDDNLLGLVGSQYRLDVLGADGVLGGEECRYLWAFESADTPVTDVSFGVGIAYAVEVFTYSDGSPVPSCATIANTDTDADGIIDSDGAGCTRPADLFTGGVMPKRPNLGTIAINPSEAQAMLESITASH